MADDTDLLASVYAQLFDGEDIDTPAASTSSPEPTSTPSMTTLSQPSYGIAAANRALASMRLSPPKGITDAAPAAHSDTHSASDPFKEDTPKPGDILTFGPLQGVIDPNGDPNLKPRPYETSPVLDNGELSDELIEPHGGPNLKPRPYSTSPILDDMELGDESTIRTESARGAGTRRKNTGDNDDFMAVPNAQLAGEQIDMIMDGASENNTGLVLRDRGLCDRQYEEATKQEKTR
ncbi:hypothetical protein NpNSSI1_00001212 [Neofusicoccum parvum]|nr:hypothetical protein NpNSSI1_00001212 [Neofusicoccum parvum]